MNLVQLLESSVAKYGDKEAMRYKSDGSWLSITYQQLWDDITRFANGLRVNGVKAGDKVAILSENCPEWVVADFAILALGAVTVPIYPTVPADQVGFILENADVTVAVVENAEQLQKLQKVRPQSLGRVIVIRGAIPTAGESQAGDETLTTFSDVLHAGHQSTSPIDLRAIDDEQLATIVHTSGTSGVPKGVMLSHRNIVSNVQSSLTLLPVEATDVSLSYLPLSHIFERTVEEFALLSTGATVCYSEGIDKIQENLAEVRPTVLVSVPRLLEKVYSKVQGQLEHAPKPLRKVLAAGIKSEKTSGMTYRLVDWFVFKKLRAGLGGRVRAVVSGGAGLAGEIARFYNKAAIPVYEGYGMTETAPVIAANPFGDSRPGTVGRAVPGVEVRTAEDGELLVRGPNVMMGYYKQDKETAKTVGSDGWLHTGDIAEIAQDGYIKIVDRKKNILVLATGKNVAPFPIENAISLSPYISEAILVGDGLKYISALVGPDFEALQPMAASLDLPADTAQWVQHPKVRDLMQHEVTKAVAKFAPFEQPKRIALLPHALTVEGGDITPSLKVRMKVIREKYGNLIDAIYAGTDFIPIEQSGSQSEAAAMAAGSVAAAADGVGTGATADSAAASSALKPAKRWSRRKWGIGAAIVLMVLVGGLMSLRGRLKLPADANLNGQIAAVGKNNGKISNVNHQIVASMQKVSQRAGMTGTIGTNLKSLQNGVNTQAELLNQLQKLSLQQVQLSRQLHSLSGSLVDSLSTVGSSAQNENQSVARMAQTAQHLSSTAKQLLASNQQAAAKLSQARSDADQVAREMP